MQESIARWKIGAFITAKITCCGLLLLLVAGVVTLGALKAWFSENTAGLMVVAGLALLAFVILRLARTRTCATTLESKENSRAKPLPDRSP